VTLREHESIKLKERQDDCSGIHARTLLAGPDARREPAGIRQRTHGHHQIEPENFYRRRNFPPNGNLHRAPSRSRSEQTSGVDCAGRRGRRRAGRALAIHQCRSKRPCRSFSSLPALRSRILRTCRKDQMNFACRFRQDRFQAVQVPANIVHDKQAEACPASPHRTVARGVSRSYSQIIRKNPHVRTGIVIPARGPRNPEL
jgi:hypothetical protein